MKVTIIGAGYVGLTTGVALAYLGHEVIAVDKDPAKLSLLREGKSPIHELGVESLMSLAVSRLSFTDSIPDGLGQAEVALIAVGTPPKLNGEADIGYVEQAAKELAEKLQEGQTCTVVVKSTVPIGTNRRVALVIERALAARKVKANVYLASNPEFLRESVALPDTLYPDRIVVGADRAESIAVLERLYRPILEQTFAPPKILPRPEGYGLPRLVATDPTSAEMTKYAGNAFLAIKISYINEIAGLCEKVGANVTEVARGVGLDPRIGRRFLEAGLGWGGSCFPKDTSALLAVASEYGYGMPIIKAAREVNQRQRQLVVDKLSSTLKVLRGRVISVLGLAFKANTDDVRESPAIDVIRTLVDRGAHVHAHDPVAIPNAQRELDGLDLEFLDCPYAAAEGSDALLIATEWDEYRTMDLQRVARVMKQPIIVDGRNIIDPESARSAGFTYLGVGK
ncbi:MAG: UDP-glucose/GDP-mannose dehydrogenase family protein [Armatimonadota bacterium]|nr:UDP-glucose/GDP-mannose dehydrogenase family protein [Armatimonadota bacterium]